MRNTATPSWLLFLFTCFYTIVAGPTFQAPLNGNLLSLPNIHISADLFNDLEELSRIVDISYCVGTAGTGITKPFLCASRCQDFPDFDLITTWNTGAFLSDSCGYIAVSHPPSAPRIIVAFRGTYSVTNTIIDLSTVPQEYVPYPGDDDRDTLAVGGPSGILTKTRQVFQRSIEPESSKCDNCTVHAGFMTSWRHTRPLIIPHLKELVERYPEYRLTLVGHSLGGAVAALASLDFKSRGWTPQVTTFGEPRIGNKALMQYIDKAFLNSTHAHNSSMFRRVTHVDDPVPLLPLSEWGYGMHSGEIYISKSDIPPEAKDLRYCDGDQDPRCIAGADNIADSTGTKRPSRDEEIQDFKEWWNTSKGSLMVPARFRIWQLFFAHRDYFWRLGLCLPIGNPTD